MIHHLIDFFKPGRMKGTYEMWQITNFELNSFDNPVLKLQSLVKFHLLLPKINKNIFLDLKCK